MVKLNAYDIAKNHSLEEEGREDKIRPALNVKLDKFTQYACS